MKHINKKNILIWIIISIVIIMPVLFFSFKIYATYKGQEKIKDENNNVIVESVNTEDNISNDITEEVEENDNAQIQYTTDNGETYSIIGKLNIPSLNINYDILSSTSTELLKISLNKYWGADPNKVGNMVVIGHNYKDNKFFSNLPEIQIGDIVEVTDEKGKTLNYSVYATDVIDPYDNSCTSQLTDGKTEITLITCYYDKGQVHATKRFVAKARVN